MMWEKDEYKVVLGPSLEKQKAWKKGSLILLLREHLRKEKMDWEVGRVIGKKRMLW